jgi:hypothetical protein
LELLRSLPVELVDPAAGRAEFAEVRDAGPSDESIDDCLSDRDGSELSFPCFLAS